MLLSDDEAFSCTQVDAVVHTWIVTVKGIAFHLQDHEFCTVLSGVSGGAKISHQALPGGAYNMLK